jgi:predicted HNH restriction endonuclease
MGVRPKDYHLYWLAFQRDSSSKRNATRLWILRPNVVAALSLLKWFAPNTPSKTASERVKAPTEPRPLDQLLLDLNVDVARSLEGSRSERLKRLSRAPTLPEKLNVIATVFRRNPDVVAEVLHRAKGICECCRRPAPFVSESTRAPYLEVHHRRFLSDGGEDTVENAVALCPNCHREKHFG